MLNKIFIIYFELKINEGTVVSTLFVVLFVSGRSRLLLSICLFSIFSIPYKQILGQKVLLMKAKRFLSHLFYFFFLS